MEAMKQTKEGGYNPSALLVSAVLCAIVFAAVSLHRLGWIALGPAIAQRGSSLTTSAQEEACPTCNSPTEKLDPPAPTRPAPEEACLTCSCPTCPTCQCPSPEPAVPLMPKKSSNTGFRARGDGTLGLPSKPPPSPYPICGPELLAANEKNPTIPLESLCAATPWLLPPRTTTLSYSGVTNEEELLALRTKPFGKYNKTISLFGFNSEWAAMAQNYMYTLVRFAEVTNFVALVWTEKDYTVCLDLNLPCWDTSRFLPWNASTRGQGEASFNSPDYNAITWLKPRVVAYLVEKGYTVHMSDVDLAYSTKPLWASYFRFLEDGGADAAFALETGNMGNTGNYVLLSTPGGRAFARSWADSAIRYNDTNDQWGMMRLFGDTQGASHQFCQGLEECAAKRKEADERGGSTAVMRLYMHAYMVHGDNICWISNDTNLKTRPVDPCHWTVGYLHPVCIGSAFLKWAILKATGFWHLDDSREAGQPRHKPLVWNDPYAEDRMWQCTVHRDHPLAFTYIPLEDMPAS